MYIYITGKIMFVLQLESVKSIWLWTSVQQSESPRFCHREG